MGRFGEMLAARYAAAQSIAEEWITPNSLPVRQQKVIADLLAASKGKLYSTIPSSANKATADEQPVVYVVGDLSKVGAMAEIDDARALKAAPDIGGVRLTPELITALYNGLGQISFVDVAQGKLSVGLKPVSAGEMGRPKLASTGDYFDMEAERAMNIANGMRRRGGM